MLLDTNIISEFWRPGPQANVLAWMDKQDHDRLFICTPVIAELIYGIERLPDSYRKRRLLQSLDDLLEGYRGRILPFDVEAAVNFGKVRAIRDTLGRSVSTIDAMIASVALANNMPLVTRNTLDFTGIGLTLIDPFSADPIS